MKGKETQVLLVDSNDSAAKSEANVKVSCLSIHFRYLNCSLYSSVRHSVFLHANEQHAILQLQL